LFAGTLEAAKLGSLEALLHLDERAAVPIDLVGAAAPPDAAAVAANAEAVRWMVQAFVDQERGDKAAALEAGLRANALARDYDIPAAVLAELAWGSYRERPEAAERAFREALRVRPDD